MTIDIKTEGRRHYIVGNTYPIKDALRAAGCKWDPRRKAWWTGKRETVASIIGGLSPEQSVARDAALEGRQAEAAAIDPAGGVGQTNRAPGDSAVVAGKALYKGRTYYVAGRVERGRTYSRRSRATWWDDRVFEVTTRDNQRVLLYSRDGKLQFWAARELVTVVKHYDRPSSIGGLRRYAEGVRNGSIATCDYCGSPSCEGARGNLCDED